jgi:hypothetical protein
MNAVFWMVFMVQMSFGPNPSYFGVGDQCSKGAL